MEKINFYLERAVLLRRRNWTLYTMNIGDIKTEPMSIERAMTWFKSISTYQGKYIPDLMICELKDGKRIFIDGGKEGVAVSLVDKSNHEYFLGYLGELELEGPEEEVKLKDFYSSKKLGSKYSF